MTENTRSIPECPRENRKQMKSILAHWKEKLEYKKNTAAPRAVEQLNRAEDLVSADRAAVENGAEKNAEMRARESILRKRQYTLSELNKSIKTLTGKIKWAERQHLPFLELEESEAVAKGELEPLEEPEEVEETALVVQ